MHRLRPSSSPSPRRLTRGALLLALAAAVGACGGGAPTEAGPAPSPAGVASPQAETPPAEERFDVRIDAPATAAAGREAMAEIQIRPRAPWHMNTEFPASLRVTGPADVDLGLAVQQAADAQCFDEDCLTFAIPFTPTVAGARELKTKVRFAVCGESACAPDTVEVALQVEVHCDTDALC